MPNRFPLPTTVSTASQIGFGLRNVTDKHKALTAMYNALKTGRVLILEFSEPLVSRSKLSTDLYSFKLFAAVGQDGG